MTAYWLYLYENRRLRSVYIGIGESMGRVFGKHNEAAEKLRANPDSVILQTVQPFSSRRDARKAEAIAIHIATLASMSVTVENEDELPFTVTNLSGVRSTSEIGPAIFRRPGEVDAYALEATVIVPIGANDLDGRPSPFGGHSGSFLAQRAGKYWNIAREKRPLLTRLIAVMKGGDNLILGDWDVDPKGAWNREPDSTRVTIPLVDPETDDPREKKGMRLTNHRLNSGVTYSQDLR